jgi:hypothetical protein
MSKSSPQPPPAPNPVTVANAQTGTNVATGVANATMGNVNTTGPNSSTTYSQSGGYVDPASGQFVPSFTQNTQLNPTLQSILTGTQNTAASMVPTGQTLANEAGVSATNPLNFAGANENVIAGGPQAIYGPAATANYDVAAGFLNPQWAQSQKDLQDQLSRQGIPVGSDAYNNAMTNFNNSKSQAYNAAANSAIGQGITSADQMFGLAIQGQNQQNQQQVLAQTDPLMLLQMLYGGGANAATGVA